MQNEDEVGGKIRPFRVLPGGAEAIPDEWYAAGIMLGALGLLWAMRRNLGAESGHVHIGGTSAIVFLLYYLIVTGLLRVGAGFLAERGDTPLARGFAFYV